MAIQTRYLLGPTASGAFVRVTYDDAGAAANRVTLLEWRAPPAGELVCTIVRGNGNAVLERRAPAGDAGSLAFSGGQRFDWQDLNFNVGVRDGPG